MFRFGILGFGHHAVRRLVPGFFGAKSSSLQGLWRRDQQKARENAAQFAIPHNFASAGRTVRFTRHRRRVCCVAGRTAFAGCPARPQAREARSLREAARHESRAGRNNAASGAAVQRSCSVLPRTFAITRAFCAPASGSRVAALELLDWHMCNSATTLKPARGLDLRSISGLRRPHRRRRHSLHRCHALSAGRRSNSGGSPCSQRRQVRRSRIISGADVGVCRRPDLEW